jgi:hypothetical protein
MPSFFFILRGELDIESQGLMITIRHFDRFLDADSYMLYFVLFHNLVFLHNDTGQRGAVASPMDVKVQHLLQQQANLGFLWQNHRFLDFALLEEPKIDK